MTLRKFKIMHVLVCDIKRPVNDNFRPCFNILILKHLCHQFNWVKCQSSVVTLIKVQGQMSGISRKGMISVSNRPTGFTVLLISFEQYTNLFLIGIHVNFGPQSL